MLTRLRIKGFKSWADTGELRLAPLTGLFGTNSSGKTSILQTLLMLKQTAESQDRRRVLHTGDAKSLVDLGSYASIIHGHDTAVGLGIDLSWQLPEALELQNPEDRRSRLDTAPVLSFCLRVLGAETGTQRGGINPPVVSAFEYSLPSGAHFGMTRRPSPPGGKGEYELVAECEGYKPKRTPGRPWPLPAPVKCYGFPDEAIGYYQNTGFLPDFGLAFEKMCERIYYLGPLREYPRHSYIWSGAAPTDVGRRGEDAVPALLASRSRGKCISTGRGRGKKNLTVEERVAAWLQEMGVIHSFELRPLAKNHREYELAVRTTSSSPEVLVTDVGFGVSQILPVLVLCYYVPRGATVILEQPEIHLHPLVQAFLGDVLVDAVKNHDIQVIVESHSEHLLRRIQRRIAEKSIAHDQTALYFCRMEEGASVAEALDVDLLGNIRNWPKDFFGDDMGDLVAMAKAASKRQGAE